MYTFKSERNTVPLIHQRNPETYGPRNLKLWVNDSPRPHSQEGGGGCSKTTHRGIKNYKILALEIKGKWIFLIL